MRDLHIKSRQPRVRGYVRWEKFDRSGKLVDYSGKKNVVTYDATDVWAALSVGLNSEDNRVSRLFLGEDGTAPDRSHSAMGSQIGSHIEIAGYSFPDTGKVTSTFLLDFDSFANGYTIRSIGLSNKNNVLLAKQAIGSLDKTVDFQFVFHWTLYFT